MPETLVIHVGNAHKLDKRLCKARDAGRLTIKGARRPRADRECGPKVLLAASAEPVAGVGSVYLVVGVLHAASLLRAKKAITFESLERFAVPLVISNSKGTVRPGLPGGAKYWSPQHFYWLPAEAAEWCAEEARRLVTLETGS
ncbi:hypothetical protein WME99_22570 [Sorangium sp. So ce136]|uniref:hypothetical protein n=1 Tax=Sorangium sp. So ce136 TaxID=3133284 RepID=UPI003F004C7D